ncbi:alpha/beta hydrolase [Nibrella saemangeumensis]|uniref:Alpha/beta hydrolase n=1 Tax=Nibrella saemangeumensis TaxID=1084526 RepID=A0ABP8N457_9BACT
MPTIILPQHHHLLIEGLRIHLIEKLGDGPTIVFLHGRCLSVKMWEKQFTSEQLASYRLIAFDLPGHGESEYSSEPKRHYSVMGLVNILKQLLDQVAVTNYILVGHSFGAHLVYQAIPHLIGCRGIVGMAMPLVKPARFDLMYNHLDILGQAWQANPAAEIITEYSRISLRLNAPDIPELVKEGLLNNDPKVHEIINSILVEGAYADETELINQCPFLVAIVLGAEEQIFNFDYIHNLQLRLWHNGPHLIQNAGHLLPWENSTAVDQMLAEFMNAAL